MSTSAARWRSPCRTAMRYASASASSARSCSKRIRASQPQVRSPTTSASASPAPHSAITARAALSARSGSARLAFQAVSARISRLLSNSFCLIAALRRVSSSYELHRRRGARRWLRSAVTATSSLSRSHRLNRPHRPRSSMRCSPTAARPRPLRRSRSGPCCSGSRSRMRCARSSPRPGYPSEATLRRTRAAQLPNAHAPGWSGPTPVVRVWRRCPPRHRAILRPVDGDTHHRSPRPAWTPGSKRTFRTYAERPVRQGR